MKTTQKKNIKLNNKSLKKIKQKSTIHSTAMESTKTNKIVQTNESEKQIPARIFITGESPMVEQYAELCIAHGYDVYISWNERLTQKPEFKSRSYKITNVIPANTSLAIELTNIDLVAKKKNIERLDKSLADNCTYSFFVYHNNCNGTIFMDFRQAPSCRYRCTSNTYSKTIG